MYDHTHWTIVNSKPLDKQMGTITDSDNIYQAGDIYFCGRAQDGKHYNLTNPVIKVVYERFAGLIEYSLRKKIYR